MKFHSNYDYQVEIKILHRHFVEINERAYERKSDPVRPHECGVKRTRGISRKGGSVG